MQNATTTVVFSRKNRAAALEALAGSSRCNPVGGWRATFATGLRLKAVRFTFCVIQHMSPAGAGWFEQFP
jgi:hypothetical protein